MTVRFAVTLKGMVRVIDVNVHAKLHLKDDRTVRCDVEGYGESYGYECSCKTSVGTQILVPTVGGVDGNVEGRALFLF